MNVFTLERNMRYKHRLFLSILSIILTIFPLITVAEGVPVIYPGSEKVQTLTMAITKANDRVVRVNEYISKQKETLVQGYESALSSINERIEAVKETVNEEIKSITDSVTESISEATQKVSDKVSSAFSSSDSTDKTAGSGFSLSKTASSVKDAYTKYGKYISPVAGFVTGNFNLQNAIAIKDAFYIDNTKTETTAEDVKNVRQNISKFIYESSKTTLTDATQVMNGSTQFNKTKEAAAQKAKEATNIKEDIDTTNGAGIAMNVMTNTLLSMDITSLGIQSGRIYQDINSLKNIDSKGGLSGLVGNIGGF